MSLEEGGGGGSCLLYLVSGQPQCCQDLYLQCICMSMGNPGSFLHFISMFGILNGKMGVDR